MISYCAQVFDFRLAISNENLLMFLFPSNGETATAGLLGIDFYVWAGQGRMLFFSVNHTV